METRTRRARLFPALFAGVLLLGPLAACGDDPGPAEQSDETNADVDCSGNSCSVTLYGDGAEADILGTQVVLGTVENGRATLRVGDRDLSCGQGESVSAGPLTLACSTVTEDAVTLTASLG